MKKEKFKLTEVEDLSGKKVLTFYPVVCETRRDVVRYFLPPGLRLLGVISVSPEDREIAASFDVKKALEKARASRKAAGLPI